MLEKYLNLFDNTCKIDVIDIPINKSLVDYCRMNACGKYNKLWTCPPAVENYYDNISDKFSKAYLLTNRYRIADSFDWEGMNEAIKDNNKKINSIIKDLKKQNYDFDCLKAGCCDLCAQCTYPDKPCRHPDLAYPTLESCGVDVMSLSKLCNIDYKPDSNTITYYNIIFYN